MRLLNVVRLAVRLALVCMVGPVSVIASRPPNPSEAFLTSLSESGLQATWSFQPESILRVLATNPATKSVTIKVPAGLICVTATGAQVLSLRDAVIALPAASTVETDVPAALLSKSAAAAVGPGKPIADRDSRLDLLLRALHERPDLPRSTSQLAVLCLTENIGIADWEAFLRTHKPEEKTGLTPAEIVQAVDAIGLLREIAPDASFALARNPELKLRALRNPWCRAKAMQLYGIALPEITPGQAPEIGQLLHTKANDNCPVCRLRRGPPGAEGL